MKNKKSLSVTLFILMALFLCSFHFLVKDEAEKDLTVKTSKQVYEYGEPIEFIVSRSGFPENDEQYYIVEDCNFKIEGILNCKNNIYDYFSECAEYCKKLCFKTERLKTKSVIWNQKACYEFEGKMRVLQVPPGDYSVLIDCDVTGYKEGITHGFIADRVNIKIEDFLFSASCEDKELQIIKATYVSKRNIVLEIRNSGGRDIENVGVIMDKCNGRDVLLRTDEILDGIKKGETKNYTIVPADDCSYDSLKVYIYDCLPDREPIFYVANIDYP